MTKYLIIILIGVFNLFYSCEKVKEEDETIQVYKFNPSSNYSKNVPVELTADKNRITSSPSELNTRWPVELESGYYLNGSMGANTGYLSLTIEEFNSFEIKPGVDSLFKLLIEKDPYLEYYHRNDDGTFRNENGTYGIDTAKINNLIKADKLGNFFERLR